MSLVAGQADAEGRYRINPRPGTRFGINAYPPAGTPYLARQTPRFRDQCRLWNAGDRVKQVECQASARRAGAGHGRRSRDRQTGRRRHGPIHSRRREQSPRDRRHFDRLARRCSSPTSKASSRSACCRAPAGCSSTVRKASTSLETSEGRVGHEANPAAGGTILTPSSGSIRRRRRRRSSCRFRFGRGRQSPAGSSTSMANRIDEALVITRLHISPLTLAWRWEKPPTLGGNFELSGLDPDREYPVYFLDPQRRLGATQVFRADSKRYHGGTQAMRPGVGPVRRLQGASARRNRSGPLHGHDAWCVSV